MTGGVSAAARELAARLSALFERDVEIVQWLNDAQRRLLGANDRLWSGLNPDAFGLLYDGAAPAGESQIAELIGDARGVGAPGSEARLRRASQETHWAIRSAFYGYQYACEERRQLAFEVGELSVQLTEELVAAGWSGADARDADVHELAVAGPR
jgi:hypothetical protein